MKKTRPCRGGGGGVSEKHWFMGIPKKISHQSVNNNQSIILGAKLLLTMGFLLLLQVEIYPGTNVFVDSLAWAVTQNCISPSTFVRNLLTAVFPLDILLVSNLRGTSRDRGTIRQPLDKLKVEAIYCKSSISREC